MSSPPAFFFSLGKSREPRGRGGGRTIKLKKVVEQGNIKRRVEVEDARGMVMMWGGRVNEIM